MVRRPLSRATCRYLPLIFAAAHAALLCHAQPTTVNYQGLARRDGALFTGTAQMKFALVGPGGSPTYWSSDGTSVNGSEPVAAVNVPVGDGIFTVALGASPMTPIDASLLATAQTASLRVWINTGPPGFEQLSDQPLSSSPFSLQSESANGATGDFYSVGGLLGGAGHGLLPFGYTACPTLPLRLLLDDAAPNNVFTIGYSPTLINGINPAGRCYSGPQLGNVRVGIGTYTPAGKLDIHDNNSNTGFVFDTNSTSGYRLNFRLDNTGASIIHDSGFRDFRLGTANLPRMTITSGGDIGINTTAPISRLDLNGTMNVSGGIIQCGGPLLTGIADMGLYSRPSGQWMRFVTNNGDFVWSRDGAIGTTNELMHLQSGGNLGIGTSTPARKLDVNGTAIVRGGDLTVDSATNPGRTFQILSAASQQLRATNDLIVSSGQNNVCVVGTASASSSFQVAYQNSGAVRMLVDGATGNVGIGTTSPSCKLHVAGNIQSTGDICAQGNVMAFSNCCPSDARFKKNITRLDGALDTICRLRGVSYDWRCEEFPERNFSDARQLGFIAQEVREVVPEIVVEGPDGYLAVDYGRLTPLLVEAARQQQQSLDELKSENAALRAELSEIRDALAKHGVLTGSN